MLSKAQNPRLSKKASTSRHKPLRVCVVTGTRSEFGLLESPIRAMLDRDGLEVRNIVTGMHLLGKFGRTINQIRKAGYRVDATVKMQTGKDDVADEPMAVSRGIAGIARALDRLECDVVLVLGDRIEAFAAACAGAVGRLVVAHIHGGDRAVGDVDESLRNAITRLAHVHLVASKDSAERLRRIGEQSWRIHRVGAPGLDAIREFRQSDRRDRAETDRRVADLLGPIAGKPYAVVIQHPCGRPASVEARAAGAVLKAVKRSGLAGVVIWPNSDPGHDGIVGMIEKLADGPGWRVFQSLERGDYLAVASRSAVLVGNSSSGIIESASLGVNALNVGSRQAGRLRCGPSVIDIGEGVQAISGGIRRALRQPRPTPRLSVYGDGRAGERIAKVLDGLIINSQLLRKQVTY